MKTITLIQKIFFRSLMLFIIACQYLMCSQTKVILVTTGPVDIMKKEYPKSLHKTGNNEVLYSASEGDTLFVKKKFYSKDFMVYKVSLKSGIVGYVFYGDSIKEIAQ